MLRGGASWFSARPRRLAVDWAPPAPPPPDPEPEVDLDVAGHARRVVELLSQGRLEEAAVHIQAHAALVSESGTAADRRDAASWVVMQALLDDRPAEAWAAAEEVLVLGRRAGVADAADRYWALRLRLVLEWDDGSDGDVALLDYCREGAYRHGELGWRAALALLLAKLGRTAESEVDFDACWEALAARPRAAAWLDMVADLAEAAG